ncbi:MAG: hypothetical protein AAF768_06375 [Pseudomonadota bacterium]
MDYQAILMAGLFGGLGAGGGALLGRLLSKTIKLNPGVLAGIGAAVGLALTRLIDFSPANTEDIRNQLEVGFANNSMFAQINAGFPEEYATFVDGMVAEARRLTPEQARQRGHDFTSGLRRQNAIAIRNASDESLRAALTVQMATLTAFKDKLGVQACAEYLAAVVPIDLAPQLNQSLLDEGEALFEAIIDGRSSEISTPSATPADWDALIEHWYARGGTPEAFVTFTNPEANDPALCDNSISFLDALISMDGDVGKIVRAESLYQSAAEG